MPDVTRIPREDFTSDLDEIAFRNGIRFAGSGRRSTRGFSLKMKINFITVPLPLTLRCPLRVPAIRCGVRPVNLFSSGP